MKRNAADLLSIALDNPLVKNLPPFMSNSQLAEKLANDPFAHIDWTSVSLADRAVLLNQLKTTFCVTETSLRIAVALQALLWDGLLARDPCQPDQRRIIYEIAEYDFKQIKVQPWRHEFIGGIIIRGITGVGKSAAVNRFLSLFPQVIQHGRNESAQWVEFRQLVYLKVPMSSDGSRGGFLQNCLRELDAALKTDYFSRHQGKQWTVERLLVNVLHYLALHRCGLLIIEEAQERNLAESQFSRDFLTFFLRLLNHSIPVVIIGNPLAFSILDSFSQDQSRFSEYGDFKIEPIFDFNDEEWSDEWMGHVWGASMLDQEDEPIENLAELIWAYTGGFPRILARLRRETINAAIQTGSTRVCREHIEIANRTPSMVGANKLISAFTNRNWRDLEQFRDIPIPDMRHRWEQMKLSNANLDPSSEGNSQVTKEPAKVNDMPPTRIRRKNGKKIPQKNRTESVNAVALGQQFEADDIRSQEYVDRLGRPETE
ncbi:hypothetical protein Rfer_1176 [Rhodoferax ferrireducens T118]|uniref:ORC1/DEAH AAA+ ATPase domain-containing protein n=1 Tax=Albidiferax ferrireducens (strain ATCC BAA-621 / DSM 15236 / T118) TaxID=338969 RepID=Q21Z91_ALBFT|nr:ATP-binding protein [Rhodoferax ferrireducens]ABD68912.1 hypothetical protein Rfer_1176 [Rhodoferax ferrireducens T118]